MGGHQGNSEAEIAVQKVPGMTRSCKAALEARTMQRIGAEHPIVKWVVRHAGVIQTLFAIGSDGKTAYDWMKGKPWRLPAAEFGERIMFEQKAKSGDRKKGLLKRASK